MSPIRKGQRDRYPKNWKAISDRIRFQRAGCRCECLGECGEQHTARDGYPIDGRCARVHTEPIPGKRPGTIGSLRGRVCLTVAHLDHKPENCSDDNLKAMCQRCHLAYDKAHHQANATMTRARRREAKP